MQCIGQCSSHPEHTANANKECFMPNWWNDWLSWSPDLNPTENVFHLPMAALMDKPPKTRTNWGMVSVQALQSIKHKRLQLFNFSDYRHHQTAWHLCLEINCKAEDYSMEVESLELTRCTRGVQDNTLRVVSRHKSLAFKQSSGRLGMQIHANWLTVLLQRYVITAHIGFSCRLQCKCRSWRIFTPLCIPFIPLYSFELFFWAALSDLVLYRTLQSFCAQFFSLSSLFLYWLSPLLPLIVSDVSVNVVP